MTLQEEIEYWTMIEPTEENDFSLFQEKLEQDPLVLFHATKSLNCDSIISNGFRSAQCLGIGELTSVSYAKRSSGCLYHIGNPVSENHVVFAVRFENLQQEGIRNNYSDIHVYSHDIQPIILGYCEIQCGYRLK